jgi:hypothetical protein
MKEKQVIVNILCVTLGMEITWVINGVPETYRYFTRNHRFRTGKPWLDK